MIRSASCLLTCERKRSTGDPPSESEFDDHSNFGIGSCVDGGNPVPLPPRDRSRSLLLVGSKPRHERKYPLIIPTTAHGPLRHHSAQENEPAYLGLDDDQVFEDDRPKEAVTDTTTEDNTKPLGPSKHKEDSEGFDERIANDFDLLDAMSEETDDENRETVDEMAKQALNLTRDEVKIERISQDVVQDSVTEISVPFDSCSKPFETSPFSESSKVFEASVKPYEISVHFESSKRPFDSSVSPFDAPVKTYEASVKPFDTSSKSFDVSVKHFEASTKLHETSSKSFDSSVKPLEASVKPFDNSVKTTEASSSFENSSSTFESRSSDSSTRSFETTKTSETNCGIPTARVEPHLTVDQRSDEESSTKRPSVNELAERLSNFDAEMSSQLSIMTKVLQNKVSEADCLRALECTGGNVHRSIKLARLMSLVGVSSQNTASSQSSTKNNGTPEILLSALEASSWDIAAAAASYLSTQPPNI